jgi:NAD(P)-dependent dehydrogenase (short-subunit alcohol dehydrogenase family)
VHSLAPEADVGNSWPDRHAGRTAVITGAATGLGQAYARRLASEGARVVLADLASADETMEMIEGAAPEPLAFACDVAIEEDVAKLAAAVKDAGGADILVHNAGIYPLQPLAVATFESWRRVMAVNLDSMFLLSKAFVPAMIDRGWGRVVGIATGMLHDGAPGALAYVASKGGIIGFVRSLAAEVGEHGVTVNAISPGLTRTEGSRAVEEAVPGLFDQLAQAQAIKRNGTPSDHCGALSFLVSDDAAFITGQTLLIDGGKANI